MDKKEKNKVSDEVSQESENAEINENIRLQSDENESTKDNKENVDMQAKENTVNEKILNFAKGKTKKEKTSDELEKAKKEIEELKSTVQRTQADFINFKRRTEKEKESMSAFANEKIIVELLGVMDNFDRALNTFEDKESSTYSGVVMIRKQVEEILKRNSVEEVVTDCKFDPNVHHAVMQDSGETPDEILEVFQKGYKIKGKVVRPAMVKVSI
ncbi:MAG: nucleotide exchange factor GrpE [Proteocatella sp.]